MPDIFHNSPLNKKHDITILSYTVELDEEYSTDKQPIDSRRTRTDEFSDTDILIARKKASDWFKNESKRLKAESNDSGNDDTPHRRLMLYFTFKKNQPDESDEYAGCERCYIMDGEDVPQMKLLGRLEQEYYHLIGAGIEFNSVEVEMAGEVFYIPLGGLFEIGKQ